MARMANSTQNKTRPKNSNRRDWTRETAIQLRSYKQHALAGKQADELWDTRVRAKEEAAARKAAKIEARKQRFAHAN